MSKGEVRASARVRVTIEVPLGWWSAASSVEEIQKAASAEAILKVERAIREGVYDPLRGCSMVGEPVVEVVMTKEK